MDAGAVAGCLASLRGALAEIESLPAGPVEPPHLWLVNSHGFLGAVCAPRAVSAVDINVEALPPRAQPGQIIALRVTLNDAYMGEEGPSAAAVAADMLAAHGVARFRLQRPARVDTIAVRGLSEVHTHGQLHGPCAAFSVRLPSDAEPESALELLSFTIAGRPVPITHVNAVVVRKVRGTPAPRVIHGACSGYASIPAISPDGVVFVGKSWSDKVLVEDAWNASKGVLSLDELGLGSRTVTAALTEDGSTLYLGEDQSANSRLLALDPTTHAVRWRTEIGAFLGDILGISVIDALGIVVACDAGGAIHSHRLSDGKRVGSLDMTESRFSAYDALSGSLFVNIRRSRVGCFRFIEGSPIPTFHGELGHLDSDQNMWRPLAVVPPAHGKSRAHLVVGVLDSADVSVFTLPSLDLIHRHTFAGIKVVGLAADPAGGALVVCDSVSRDAHVLAWPLEGMPELA